MLENVYESLDVKNVYDGLCARSEVYQLLSQRVFLQNVPDLGVYQNMYHQLFHR